MNSLRYGIYPRTPYWLKNSAWMLCAFAFLILLLVLFIRPTGLFGKEEIKRV